MAGEEQILEISQAGIEATRGTAVPATRKVYMKLAPWSYERELMWASNTTGTFEERREAAYRRPRHGFTGTEDLTFDDLGWWLEHILCGGVAGVGDGGTPIAYTRGYVPQLAVDDLKSSTLEYGTPTLPYEANQVMVNSATFRFAPDDQAFWQMDAEMFARKPSQVAMTGSIAERTRELIKAPGTKLFIDNSGGTFGTTQMLARFIGGSITVLNNLSYKAFSEDEDDFAANKVGRGARLVDAQFSFEFDTDAEYANYRAASPVERLIRVEREGSTIHTTVKKRARFDLHGYWSSIEPGYRESNKILTFGLQGRYNPTAAHTLKAEVVNQLITLP